MERMEEEQKIGRAIDHHMKNTEWDGRTNWGPWFLNEKTRELDFMTADPGGTLKPMYYTIPLNRLLGVHGRDNNSIEDWSLQLHGKTWVSFDDSLQLVEALCCLYKADWYKKQVKV